MTEQDWLTATDPAAMLDFLRDSGKLSERKARLFAAAVCRRIWPLLTDERLRQAVEIAERYADGTANTDDRIAAAEAAGEFDDVDEYDAADDHISSAAYEAATAAWMAVAEDAAAAARHSMGAVADAVADAAVDGDTDRVTWLAARQVEHAHQSTLLRDIVNPFPTAQFNLAWRTPAVMELARRAYELRSFDRLPDLAQLLEDQGCDDAELLGHLRGPGPFVRGDWALDLVLSKE